MNFSVDELLAYASQHEQESWITLARKIPFRYHVTRSGIEYTPQSGLPRVVPRSELDSFFHEFFDCKLSLSPGDYPDRWHKSYTLPIIKRFLASLREEKPLIQIQNVGPEFVSLEAEKILAETDSRLTNPHQRVGAESNAHVGRDFENVAREFFLSQGIDLQLGHMVMIGIGQHKKNHAFDLGCDRQKILVECKSHRWTVGANIPSAKLTVWNEAMYYFLLAPEGYRKIMFVLRHVCDRRGVTLAEYYLNTYSHLIPSNVEFLEYDDNLREIIQLKRQRS